MTPFVTEIPFRSFRSIAFVLAAVAVFTMPAAAQHGLNLSKQADFSTSDRLFVDGETIYIKVEPGAGFDAASITESSFEVEPTRDGDDYEGTLSLQDDGSFTGSVEVSALEGNSTAWHLHVEIEDAFDREYEARTALVIRGRSGRPDVFRIAGIVEAASATEITVSGRTIAVTSETKLHSRTDIGIADLTGHRVLVSVQQAADEGLTALQIFVGGEQDASITFAGIIQSVGDASIHIRGVELAVNEHTVIETGSGEPLTLSDLQPRMPARVKAQRTAEGWVATSITVRGEDEDEEEEEVEGAIEEIGDGFIVVAGVRVEISDRTDFEGAQGLDDLEVGMQVEVEFVTTGAGAFVATKIEVEDEDDDDENEEDDIKVEGLITALGDFTVTVEGIEFSVVDETVIKGAGRDRLEFADLSTGLHVEVKGFMQDGVAVAGKIEVEVEKANRAHLRGEITALGDRTATVSDTEFMVTEDTEIRSDRGRDLTFEDLEVGMHAHVHLVGRQGGIPTALRMKVKRPFEKDDVTITGRIEAVSPTEITVRGHTFAMNDDTEIENQRGDAIAAEDLTVGAAAKVEGTMAGDGTLVATEIRVRGQLHREGRFAGLVTAIGADVLSVNGIEFDVTPDTIFEGAESLGDLAIGTRVKLRFRRLGDGSRLALRIQVKTDDDAEAVISGAIEEIDGDVIVVAGVDVTTSAATEIEDEDGDDATIADLEVGQIVEVEGIAVPGGILATKIEIEDAVVIAGAVSAPTDNTVQLAGITFRIDGETLIIGRENALLRIDDLKAGAYVEVIATAAAGKNGSTMTAERVLVIESASTSTSRDADGVPASFTLDQNYPNPFNPTTNITFELDPSAAAGAISLAVYDVLGRRIATLLNGTLSAGTHTYRWDGLDDIGRAAGSGVYLYRLSVGEQTATRSMILTK